MDRLPYLALILFAGTCWPMQAAINAELRARAASQPLFAVIVNGAGGALVAAVVLLWFGIGARRLSVPTPDGLASAPWWAWVGGVFSLVVIVAQSMSARPLGAALLVTAFLGGQVVAGLVFDQFGLMRYEVRAITPARLAGVALVLGGLVLLGFDGMRTQA